MNEAPDRLEFAFRWTPAISRDFDRHRAERGPVVDFVYGNFLWVALGLFFCVWGLMAILAGNGVFPADRLGLVLKATAAGYVAALLPVLALVLLWPSRRLAEAESKVCCDAEGCRIAFDGVTSFMPWPSVAAVIETRHGLILRSDHLAMAGIYDERLRDRTARRQLLERIETWREAAR